MAATQFRVAVAEISPRLGDVYANLALDKRRLPFTVKISNRTIDRDFRYARDCGR